MALDAELDAVKGKSDKEIQGKRENILRKWIPEMSIGRRFKDPAKD